MHLLLNGCQPSCQTNYFKTIVLFGIDATAQVIVPCQWHIQLKQFWIGVLEGLLCLVQSYQWTKNNLRDSVPAGSTVRWLEHVAPSQGSSESLVPVPFTANDRRHLSSVCIHNAKKAYGSKSDGSCESADSWLELRVAGWTGLWAVGVAVRYDHHYLLADDNLHTASYTTMGPMCSHHHLVRQNFKQTPDAQQFHAFWMPGKPNTIIKTRVSQLCKMEANFIE